MKRLFIGTYNPSIILTYISVFCSVCSMGLLMYGYKLELVMVLFVIAGICDMFDGAIARKCKRTDREKEFGVQLDSLADIVSFVILPCCILFSICGFNAFSLVVCCFYAFAGIMRLGWFNITTSENNGIYRGLPVTYSALIFTILYIIVSLFNILNIKMVFYFTYIVVSLLFILNFKIKKPNKLLMVFFVILAAAAIVVLWLHI